MVVCKHLEFGRVYNLSFGKEVITEPFCLQTQSIHRQNEFYGNKNHGDVLILYHTIATFKNPERKTF